MWNLSWGTPKEVDTFLEKDIGVGHLDTGRLYLLTFGLLFAALLVSACGSGRQKATPQPKEIPTVASPGSIKPKIASSDLAVGSNRFVVRLVDQRDNDVVIGSRVHLRIFKGATPAGTATLKAEVDARTLTVQRNYTHVHEDGKLETHEARITSAYIAQVEFDSPGTWSVEISGMQQDGQPLPTLTHAFTVQKRSGVVSLRTPAPRTIQPVLSDVKDISEIDTSNPPDPDMHSMTVAKAVKSGKPTVVVFATPGFCLARTCGSVKDKVDQLYENYKGRANFIHIEPYDLEKARSGQGLEPVPALAEWGLETEPWIFMVDREGKVVAKFEGPVRFEELEEALTPQLASSLAH